MNTHEAIKILRNTAWLGTNEDREKTEQAIEVVAEALEQEPKRGKWIRQGREIDGNYRYMCSECEHIDIQAEKQEVPYCWYCGVRMESDTE